MLRLSKMVRKLGDLKPPHPTHSNRLEIGRKTCHCEQTDGQIANCVQFVAAEELCQLCVVCCS